MGTSKLPAIFRIMRWFEHRATLCRLCRKAPRRIDGYCSVECAEFDAEMQAIT